METKTQTRKDETMIITARYVPTDRKAEERLDKIVGEKHISTDVDWNSTVMEIWWEVAEAEAKAVAKRLRRLSCVRSVTIETD